MNSFLVRLRKQPEYIRQRVAFGSSVAATAVVAAGWLAVVAASGTLSLSPVPSSSGSSDTDFSTALSNTRSSFSSLLGAVGAADTQTGQQAGVVIETKATTTLENEEPTVLPF